MTPSQIHSLWLLLKYGERFHSKDLDGVGKQVFEVASAADVATLLDTAESLGLVTRTVNHGWVATIEGGVFGGLKHWRYWQPDRIPSGNPWYLKEVERPESRPSVIDLFCGAGGLSLGFETAGFTVRWAVDEDPIACESFRKNFPNCLVRKDDIRAVLSNIGERGLANFGVTISRPWGIIGGPPCQGFSVVGEKDPSDPRNSLVPAFLQIVNRLEPDFFVMENVRGLVDTGKTSDLNQSLRRDASSVGPLAARIRQAIPVSVETSRESKDGGKRKRLVAEAVRRFTKSENELTKHAGQRWPLTVSAACKLLRQTLELHIASGYPPQHRNAVSKGLDACTAEIAKLAIAVCAVKFDLWDDHTDLQSLLADLTASSYVDPSIATAANLILATHKAQSALNNSGDGEIGPFLQSTLEVVRDKYNISSPLLLNAVDYGTPQNRRRLFLVGIHKKYSIEFGLLDPSVGVPLTCGEALDDLPDVDACAFGKDDRLPTRLLRLPSSNFMRSARLEYLDAQDKSIPRPTWNPFVVDGCKSTVHTSRVRARYENLPQGGWDKVSRRARLSRYMPAPTIRAGTMNDKGSHTAARPIHYDHHRVTTVREAARLMGYPDWMSFHSSKWHGYWLVGNGVTRDVGAAIASKLLTLLSSRS